MSLLEKFKRSLGFSGKEREQLIHDDWGMDLDDDFISPEPILYEIIVIQPRSMDDMDYVHDHIVEENNPVIVDLTYLADEGEDILKMAGEKINILREQHKTQSISLCNTLDKKMIILAPPQVKIIKKD